MVVVLITALVIVWFLLSHQSVDDAEAQGLVPYPFFTTYTQVDFTTIMFGNFVDDPAVDLWKQPHQGNGCEEHETLGDYDGLGVPFKALGLTSEAALTLGTEAGSTVVITTYPDTIATVRGTTVTIPANHFFQKTEPSA